MTMISDLGDRIARLTLADAAQLRVYMKDRFGIEPLAGGTVVAPDEADEPTVIGTSLYDVVLNGVDATKKIAVIKTVRELTGAGLVEAKAMVETPSLVIRPGLEKADAEQLKAKLEAAGGTVTLKAA